MSHKINFVVDFLFSEVNGGAELNTETMAEKLKILGNEIKIIKSIDLTIETMKDKRKEKFIFGNFTMVSNECKEYAIKNLEYLIYEQDHKYLKCRNPIFFPNFKAPVEQRTNIDFYKNAKKVLFLTKLAEEVFVLNTELNNTLNLKCSLWSKEDLEKMKSLSTVEKNKKTAILDSKNPTKKFNKCVEYCKNNNLEFEAIKDSNYHKFLEKMSKFSKFVFFTGHLETCARILVEAKMMNLKVIYPKNLIGAASEEWFKYSGRELVEKIEVLCEEIPEKVMEILND